MPNTPKVYFKVSKNPFNPNAVLIGSYIKNDAVAGPLPSKEVFLVLDASTSMSEGKPKSRIELAKEAAEAMVKELKEDDYISVVTFNSTAKCVVKRVRVGENKAQVIEQIRAIALNKCGTNVQQGLEIAFDQLVKENIEKTSVMLLSDGEVTAGEADVKKLFAILTEKLGPELIKLLRIIPIGIGTKYMVAFMTELGRLVNFNGLIHLDDDADPNNAFTAAKEFLLPRSKPITLTIKMSEQQQSQSLGCIDYNQIATALFEVPLLPGIDLKDVKVECKAKIGEEEIIDILSLVEEIKYDPELVAKRFTKEYLSIMEDAKSNTKQKIDQLKSLLQLLETLKAELGQYQVIHDVHKTIADAIHFKQLGNEAKCRGNYARTLTLFSRLSAYGARTLMTKEELLHIKEYDQAAGTLSVNNIKYKVLTENVDLNDTAKNGTLFVSMDAVLHNREAILIDTQSDTFKNTIRELIQKIKLSHELDLDFSKLNTLCDFVRNNFYYTDFKSLIELYIKINPKQVLELPNGKDVPCVFLDLFYTNRIGVCRQYALFAATALLHLIQEGLLPSGTVKIPCGTADDQKAHSWVYYHPTDVNFDHLIFLIDTTNPGQKFFIFDLKKISNREKDADFENAILNYRQRGLEGLLIEMLSTYKIPLPNIPPSDKYQVSEDFIAAIQAKIDQEKKLDRDDESKTQEALINERVIDPISLEIIVEPVRTDDKIFIMSHRVYDRDFISAWLIDHDTNPLTGEKLLSKRLTPAYDEVNRINRVLAGHLGIIKPEEVNSTIAIYRRPELTEEAKLAKLNARDRNVLVAIERFKFHQAKISRVAAPSTSEVVVSASPISSASATLLALSAAPNPTLVVAGATAQEVVPPPISTTTAVPMSLPPSLSPATPTSALSANDADDGTPNWMPPDEVAANNGDGTELRNIQLQGQGDANDHWFTVAAKNNIYRIYPIKRGFKLFGYSSDESLRLYNYLHNTAFANYSAITREVDNYLADQNNKGKRLYDILIEEKIKAKKIPTAEELESNPNYIWLDDNVVYLIQQKYKQQRGFIFFGYSCDESLYLLTTLNNPAMDMSEKQTVIEFYLNNDTYNGKRLYNILIEIKNMCSPAVPAQEARIELK